MTADIISARMRRAAARPGRGRAALEALGVSVLAIGAGVAAANGKSVAVVLAAGALLALYVWLAKVNPRGAVIVMFASLALVPVYAAPTYRSFSPEPTAVAALILAVAFAGVGGRIRFTIVDTTFAVTCTAMVVAAWLGPHSLLATGSELFLWVPPYIAGRAVCKRRKGPEIFIAAAVAAGLMSLPFILYETVSHQNVFFRLARPGTELSRIWAKATFRPGGLLRSQGAFGHPLSMSLILGSCAVFALALALKATSRSRRIGWLLAAACLVLGQYTSHERSGWFVVIGGILALAAFALYGRLRLRHVLVAGMIIVPLVLLGIAATHPRNGEASVARTESTADRVNLWRHAFEPGALGLVGLPETTTFNHFANAIRPGQVAIDSGLLQVGDIYGVVAFAALFTVFAAVVRVAVALRGDWRAVIPAVALVDLAALTVIAFQTQVPIFIWLVVGGVSGIDLQRRSRRFGTSGEASRPATALLPEGVGPIAGRNNSDLASHRRCG